MTLLKVGGVILKSPTAYRLKFADIDSSNSGRSESGIMTREVVRKKIATLNVEFANVTTSESQAIIAAVNADFVEVDFYDGTDTLRHATMYTSELDFELVSSDGLWTVSFQLTEQ